MRRHSPISAVVIFGIYSLAHAQTITVNTVDDVVDFGGAQQVGNLPGPDGQVSFREACIAANNTVGPQTIAFAIPQSEWWLIPQIALLRLESGVFQLTDNATTVDFTTQAQFTGDTNPGGNEVGIYGLEPNGLGSPAIIVSGNDCVIKGLDQVMQRGYGVEITGNNNRVISSTIGGPLYAAVYITGGFNGPYVTANVVGGTQPGEGNTLSAGNSGVRVDGPADGNVIIGNTLSGAAAGVEVRSATCCPNNNALNTRIGGPTPAERNFIRGAGRIGQEGFPSGAQVALSAAIGTVVEGNYIGTTADGSAAFPNQSGPAGVSAVDSPGTIVRNNLISGILVMGTNHAAGQRFGTGISLAGNCSNTQVVGNLIGTDANGTAAIPNRAGISVTTNVGSAAPTGIQIGSPGHGNTIAFNETVGVSIAFQISNVRISANSIFENGMLGIDLFSASGAGVTPNDPADPDSGANQLQNFPVTTSASSAGAAVTIDGTLNSLPGQAFTLEFFASSVCDPSGFGEGKMFLGATSVTTDGSGNAVFSITLPQSVPAGWVATATATQNSTGNTSEFSACTLISGGSATGDLNGDGRADAADRDILVNVLLGIDTNTDHVQRSDLNGDGVADALDIQPFVNLVAH